MIHENLVPAFLAESCRSVTHPTWRMIPTRLSTALKCGSTRMGWTGSALVLWRRAWPRLRGPVWKRRRAERVEERSMQHW